MPFMHLNVYGCVIPMTVFAELIWVEVFVRGDFSFVLLFLSCLYFAPLQYYYTIKDISVGGMCICYGHAQSCPMDPVTKVTARSLQLDPRQSGTPPFPCCQSNLFDAEGVKFRDRLSAVELIVLNVTQASNTFM